VAQIIESVGTDRVMVMDVHNLAAYQNAFRCPTDHLEGAGLFIDYFASRFKDGEIVVASPDIGGVKRAERFRQGLSERLGRDLGSAFMEKQRSAGVVSGEAVVGEVNDKTVIIIDDLISTGGTLSRTAKACRRRGARRVYAAATHGIFVGDANQVLADPSLDEVVITDTIPPFRLSNDIAQEKLTILSTANLFAQAIRRIHTGGSIVELLL
jgi:ribose-phosphate pyrophosphokinase